MPESNLPSSSIAATASTTDVSERQLESLIVRHMTALQSPNSSADWIRGDAADYDRANCLDVKQLVQFIQDTQPEIAAELSLGSDTPTRRRFLDRISKKVNGRGVIDVLRKPLSHGLLSIDLYAASPSAGNDLTRERHALNRFSVTRQLRYSDRKGDANKALDLALFVNGLPVATLELKNSYTGQMVEDAIEQYKNDRASREPLFRVGRCLAHFAVDDNEVWFCTKLDGKDSWFLPFNQGVEGGAGNPVNPNGIKTDYLWRETLSRESLVDIIENYALLTGKGNSKSQIWPRYHQLDAVRQLLADVGQRGVGGRYLVQHSAGSGKSNSIAWLAHRLTALQSNNDAMFDSVIVITDRVALDSQITQTVRQFAGVDSFVGHADRSSDLGEMLASGKRIIISTVQKFPHILNQIHGQFGNRKYAIIIDEAHSSQGGQMSTDMARALGLERASKEEMDYEDLVNSAMESRRMLANASYFAFTATPKNRTLEMFGSPTFNPETGTNSYRAFHEYTMKQAIEENFILDVVSNYTEIRSYYNIAKTIEDDPEFEERRAQQELRRYVEGHERAIELKASIMVDHFLNSVHKPGKIGGKARAMVVTDRRSRAVDYFVAIRKLLKERDSDVQAIVAFTGDLEHGGATVTESSLNGFPSSRIVEEFQKDPYRIMVCAEKFQTGYDEPLLHTMYVDKPLDGIKAVQTLSRLNRARRGKLEVFALDFANNADDIQEAFSTYYRATILSRETDVNRLNDLREALESFDIYDDGAVEEVAKAFLTGVDRSELDPPLDACAEKFKRYLDEDDQVKFKSNARSFVRAYNFLSQIMPASNRDWETLSIFLRLLIPKLPILNRPENMDLLSKVDMESYRADRMQTAKLILDDDDTFINPPNGGGGGLMDDEEKRLSEIVREFNEVWGGLFDDGSRGVEVAVWAIAKTADDHRYYNARKNSSEQNARIEHDRAMKETLAGNIQCAADFFKAYMANEDFRDWLNDKSFNSSYRRRDG